MITKEQFADFGMDALFIAYGDGIVTKTSVGWDGYLREVPIDLEHWAAAKTLLEVAQGNLTGIAWGYRFSLVLAGTTYGGTCPKTGRSASVCEDLTHAACPDLRP